MNNLGLMYHKTCYEKIEDVEYLSAQLTAITKSTFSEPYDFYRSGLEGLSGFQSFQLETIYPGLAAGLGYAHGISSEKDSKLGFSFDYVTGQPYLPGSTVKGMLRSCFAYPDLVQDVFQTPDLDVKALETAIFDGGADVFLDSVIARGDSRGRIMGEDYITPHASPIKNPVPIKFFKVLPGVAFEFRFLLTDTELNGTVVSAERKAKAFQALLKITGIGAKTNVGYGGLQEKTEREPIQQEPPTQPRYGESQKKTEWKPRGADEKREASKHQDAPEGEPFVKGQIYQGIVTNIKGFYIYLRVNGEIKCSIKLNSDDDISTLDRGATLRVTYLGCRNGWYSFSTKDVK